MAPEIEPLRLLPTSLLLPSMRPCEKQNPWVSNGAKCVKSLAKPSSVGTRLMAMPRSTTDHDHRPRSAGNRHPVAHKVVRHVRGRQQPFRRDPYGVDFRIARHERRLQDDHLRSE